MIMNSALLLLVRSVSTALLSMAGGNWVLVYYVSDMGLYFMYKILRRDFWHWAPLVGAANVVWSILNRLIVKVLVGHTGVIQFRGAGEMGGCYFAFDMVRDRPLSYLLRPLQPRQHANLCCTLADHGARCLVRRHSRLLRESRRARG